jgi:hypothetical protein
MASRVSGPPALLTPSLLAQTARLHAELADLVERSRDQRWWARQLRAAVPMFPPPPGECFAAVLPTTMPPQS